MFKLNSNCINIHLYVTPLNFDDSEITGAVPEIVISESDDEWKISNEYEQSEGEETDSMSSLANEEEMRIVMMSLVILKKNMMLLLLIIRTTIRCQFILIEA